MFKVKLKPCPFCGSEAEVGLRQERDDYGNCIGSAFYAVNCKACGAEAGNREKQLSLEPKEMAIVAQEEWNTRSANPARWIVSSDGYYPYCSNCGARPATMTKYCAECGCEMRKEVNT